MNVVWLLLAGYGGGSLVLDVIAGIRWLYHDHQDGHDLDQADTRGTADHPSHVKPGQGDL